MSINIQFGTDAVVLQDRKASLAKYRPMMASYDDGPLASAVRVGADLRAARERLGWGLAEIAAHLRIRRPYLAALEDGRIGDLPGVAYAAGFLRTYATALGLDPAEMSRRFRAEVVEANCKTELNFPAPVPDRGVPAGAVVLIAAVLAIGAYVGWYRMSERTHPLDEMVQPVPAQLAALAEKDAPPPAPTMATPAPEAAAPVAVADAPPPQAISPRSAAAAVTEPPPVVAVPPPPAAVAAAAPPPAVELAALPVSQPAVAPGNQIVLHATADSWIQVRDGSGQVLLNRVLRSGESWTVPDRPSLLLTTGNAGGTEVLLDGVASASLGNDGAVRRDLPLDAAAIKAGRLAPAPRHKQG